MCYKINVKFKINFEKINFADSSIIILKRTLLSFLNVKNEKRNENRFES